MAIFSRLADDTTPPSPQLFSFSGSSMKRRPPTLLEKNGGELENAAAMSENHRATSHGSLPSEASMAKLDE